MYFFKSLFNLLIAVLDQLVRQQGLLLRLPRERPCLSEQGGAVLSRVLGA